MSEIYAQAVTASHRERWTREHGDAARWHRRRARSFRPNVFRRRDR